MLTLMGSFKWTLQTPCVNLLWWRKKSHAVIYPQMSHTWFSRRNHTEKSFKNSNPHGKMILPHVFFICSYYSSNPLGLLSSWTGAASPHTNTLPLKTAHARAANARPSDHVHNLQTEVLLQQEPSKLLYLHGHQCTKCPYHRCLCG